MDSRRRRRRQYLFVFFLLKHDVRVDVHLDVVGVIWVKRQIRHGLRLSVALPRTLLLQRRRVSLAIGAGRRGQKKRRNYSLVKRKLTVLRGVTRKRGIVYVRCHTPSRHHAIMPQPTPPNSPQLAPTRPNSPQTSSTPPRELLTSQVVVISVLHEYTTTPPGFTTRAISRRRLGRLDGSMYVRTPTQKAAWKCPSAKPSLDSAVGSFRSALCNSR